MKYATLPAAITGTAFAMCIHPSPADSNKALVTRFWDEVWNPPYSMDTFNALIADDFSISTDGKSIQGKEPFREWLQGFQSKISNLRAAPQEILVTDDGTHVITRMQVTGRNKGLFGTQANEAPVEFIAISIIEVRDGKLIRNWVERSAFELYQRLSNQK